MNESNDGRRDEDFLLLLFFFFLLLLFFLEFVLYYFVFCNFAIGKKENGTKVFVTFF